MGGIGLSSIAGFSVLSLLLFVVSTQSFLVFHTVAELFAIVVAFTAFGMAWYSRRWIGANYLLMLGFGHLFVGFIDIVHTVTYPGLSLVQNVQKDVSTQLWIAGRAVEAVAFVIAIARPLARFSVPRVALGFGIAVVVLGGLIVTQLFPTCFVPGEGLTPFKIGAEYAIIGCLLFALVLLRMNAASFDPLVARLLAASIAMKVAQELSFTLYVDPHGIANFIGHIFKIAAFFLFLRAIVETGLNRPQALIFGALEREKALAESVSRHATTLDAVLDASMDPLVMVDCEGRFRFASRAAQDFLGMRGEDLETRDWSESGLPLSAAATLDALCRRVMAAGAPATEEIVMPADTGARCLEVQVSPVQSALSGGLGGAVVVLRDISARKVMEEDLKSSLAENQVLMLEVHHRVKNNLQIVSSILQMQGWRVSDPSVRVQFEEACGRILSLAKVHEMLYKEHNVASVDMVRYIRSLCDELFRMYGVRDDWVNLRIEPGGLLLPLDRAVPLALIVHELITNALKHAFSETGGELRIGIAATGADEGCLVVSDDGRGMRHPDFEGQEASLGLRMVTVLVKQIHGKLNIGAGPGSSVEIRFPLGSLSALGPEAEMLAS